MKISLCMIVKDEENNILNCLARALEVVDEAIVVDTGSVDKTKELIKEKYTDDRVKVIEHIWENDFSKARNESLKYATGDWILVLDADERIFSDRKKIENLLNKNNNRAYIIPIYNILDEDNMSVTSTMIRLYKNDNPRYIGAIHEQIQIDGKSFMPDIIESDICKIYHYGYSKVVFEQKNKQNRNMDIIKAEIDKDPHDSFNWYNKGIMEMIQGNYDIAIDDFLKSHKLSNKKRMAFHNDLILRVIQCMMIQKDHKKVIDFVKTISTDLYIGKIPDIYYYCGIAYANIKKNSLAIKYFKKAINIGEYEKGTSKFGTGSFLPKLEWARLLLSEKKTMLAIEKYKEAVFDENNVKHQGLDELKYLLEKENLTDEIQQLESFINRKQDNNQLSHTDLEKYKSEVKENIKNLVESGMVIESKELIKQYEEIVQDDVDIYSIKGVIAMIEGNMDEAEKVLLKGLSLDSDNFDLLYNLAYLYQVNNQNELAIKYYKKAFQNAENEDDANGVYEILKNLGVEETKEEMLENFTEDAYYANAKQFEKEGKKSDAALMYGLTYRYDKNAKYKNDLITLYNDSKPLKDVFSVAATSMKNRFIILSSCGWGNIYQRMHHIARSLVKFGQEVIYITPTVSANVHSNNIDDSYLTKHSFDNFKIIDGVKIYTPIAAMYNQQQITNNYINLVQELLDSPTDTIQTVIITYMPYQVKVINSLKGNFMHVYECVDDHSDLEYAFWGNKKNAIWEQELMDSADAITTTATSLFLQRRAIEERKNVYLSRNAVNEGDFVSAEQAEVPEDLKDIPEPRIVYVGAIYEWFDVELFYNVVKSNPDKSFVIIGFGKEEILKEKCPNLYILGPKKHCQLHKYLKNVNVGLIPFRADTDIVVNCDAIKLYEYIACGLPVVTTYMPESGMDKIYTFLANTKEEFNDAIEKCLHLDLDQSTITNFLAENSWNARAALLCRLANKSISREEQEESIRHIGEELDKITAQYGSSTFKTLKALHAKLEDDHKFEKLTQEAYKKEKTKYTERQYLTALLNNKKTNEFMEVVLKSDYIRKEVRQELLFRKKINDLKYMDCLFYLCIANIRESLNLVNKIDDKDIKLIYKSYINHILGEEIDYNKLNFITNKNQKSPILKFLKKEVKGKKDNGNIKNTNTYISDMFNNISQEFIETLSLNNIKINGICTKESGYKNETKKFPVERIVEMQKHRSIKVMVPYNEDYVKQVRILAEKGIKECEVVVASNEKIVTVNIDKDLMRKIKEKDYNRTITFNKFNAADSNVHALIKYMPEEYKAKYKLNVIYGRDVWSIENIVKVPLISNVTVSGFATFLYNYPKLTYNIEVGHGGLQLKACGLMDKKDKNSGGNPAIYEKADVICVASQLNMVTFSSFYAIPENKYAITGLPRNDLLALPESKKNLEKLIGINLDNKKIIFNMPTFHISEQVGRIEGSEELNDSFKIKNFNYEEFDKFLESNDMICISKVHHGEEKTITERAKKRKYKNMFFINNDDIENKNLDLYEVLGAADLLITDYSTVYNDFLFMKKPTIFVNTDIEEYRKERGLVLEPYDFWTAGPKVKSQKELQKELIKCFLDSDYYKKDRENLLPVFFKYLDLNSIKRTWNIIDESCRKIITC